MYLRDLDNLDRADDILDFGFSWLQPASPRVAVTSSTGPTAGNLPMIELNEDTRVLPKWR